MSAQKPFDIWSIQDHNPINDVLPFPVLNFYGQNQTSKGERSQSAENQSQSGSESDGVQS
jgi:hypothetical protein